MADNDDVDFESDEDSPKGKKGLILILLLLVLGGAGAGLYFSGMIDEYLPKGEAEETTAPGVADGEPAKEDDPAAVVYYELPHIMANLNPGGATPSFIKMTINLEAPNQEVLTRLEAIQPKVMDIINTYVRELRPSDLNGSSGIYRLRDELLLRINKALYPDKVNNILFKDILIQ